MGERGRRRGRGGRGRPGVREKEVGGVRELWAARAAALHGSSLKGEKMDFSSSYKVCIVAQRGALMTVKVLRGQDNLGSVPPAPWVDQLPKGHRQCRAAKLLPLGARHPLPGY